MRLIFLLVCTASFYASAKKKIDKDDSEETDVNVQQRLKPFIRSLEDFLREDKASKWFDEARRKRHGVYLSELGPLISDVIDVVDSRLPMPSLAIAIDDKLRNLRIASTKGPFVWRYTGKPEEYDKNVADLGRKFAWRMFELLDKIRSGDHSSMEDGVLKRLRKVRHRLEKYWTRMSVTTPAPPMATTTPAPEPDKEL